MSKTILSNKTLKVCCQQGKTLQTISLLAYLKESRGVRGPHIAIVPKSVVGNWIRELHRWCPSIRAVRMGGTKEERQNFIKHHLHGGFDVLVTSYEGFLREKSKLGKVKWHYLIIDEVKIMIVLYNPFADS